MTDQQHAFIDEILAKTVAPATLKHWSFRTWRSKFDRSLNKHLSSTKDGGDLETVFQTVIKRVGTQAAWESALAQWSLIGANPLNLIGLTDMARRIEDMESRGLGSSPSTERWLAKMQEAEQEETT